MLEEQIATISCCRAQVRDGALTHAKKLLAIGCFCIGTNQVDLEVTPPDSPGILPCPCKWVIAEAQRGHARRQQPWSALHFGAV